MNRVLFLLVVLLITFSNGQIVITQEDLNLKKPFTSYVYHYDDIPFDLTETKGSIKWDFRDATVDNQNPIHNFVDPKKTQFLKDFPDATHAASSTGTLVVYSKFNENEMSFLGIAGSMMNIEFILKYTPGLTFYKFPLKVGSSWSKNFTATGFDNVTVKGSSSGEVDAQGILITNEGEYPCIRIRTETRYYERNQNGVTTKLDPQISKTVIYQWITKNNISATVSLPGSGGSTQTDMFGFGILMDGLKPSVSISKPKLEIDTPIIKIPTSDSGARHLKEGETVVGAKLGFSDAYGAQVGFAAIYEKGVKEKFFSLPFPSTLGLGATFAYSSYSDNFLWGGELTTTNIVLLASAYYHIDLLHNPKLDTYILLGLGFNFGSVSYNGITRYSGSEVDLIAWNGGIGSRYYFSPKTAFSMEVGSGIGRFRIGLDFKL